MGNENRKLYTPTDTLNEKDCSLCNVSVPLFIFCINFKKIIHTRLLQQYNNINNKEW